MGEDRESYSHRIMFRYIKIDMKQAPNAIAGACFVLGLFYFASGSKDNGCVPNIVVKLLTLKRYALLEKSRVTS